MGKASNLLNFVAFGDFSENRKYKKGSAYTVDRETREDSEGAVNR